MAEELKRALRFDDRYGLTDAEWAVAEILHEGCWCESERDDYEGCGPESRGADAKRAVAAVRPGLYEEAAEKIRNSDNLRIETDDHMRDIEEAADELDRMAAALRSNEKGTSDV